MHQFGFGYRINSLHYKNILNKYMDKEKRQSYIDRLADYKTEEIFNDGLQFEYIKDIKIEEYNNLSDYELIEQMNKNLLILS